MAISAGKLWGYRRLSDEGGRFKMVAVDQRPPIKALIREKLGTDEAPFEEVCAFKRLLAETLGSRATALLLDPYFAYPAAIDAVSPRQGLLLTLEDSVFRDTPEGRLSGEIEGWSVPKIRRIGGDGVKVLAWYRPDAAPSVVEHQQRFVRAIGEACQEADICFLLELLVYPLAGDAGQTTDYVEHRDKRPQLVVDSVRAFADPAFGVDIFKLESPVAAEAVPEKGAAGSDEAQAWFDEVGAASPVPWVMLSAGCSATAFERVLRHAYAAGASGYLAGRAIWLQAAQAYPDKDAMRRALETESAAYMDRLNTLTDQAARPWFDHPGFGGDIRPAGADRPGFNTRYGRETVGEAAE